MVTRYDIFKDLLLDNYNPRPHLTDRLCKLYSENESIFTRNPMRFVRFMRHNLGQGTGEQILEMFYDKIEELKL